MKILYVPFRNNGVRISLEQKKEVINDFLNAIPRHGHLDEGEKARLVVYMSNISDSLLDGLESPPPWLDSIKVVWTPEFNEDWADQMVLKSVDGNEQSVIVMKIVPEGMLDEAGVKRLLIREREKWKWAYCASIGITMTPGRDRYAQCD